VLTSPHAHVMQLILSTSFARPNSYVLLLYYYNIHSFSRWKHGEKSHTELIIICERFRMRSIHAISKYLVPHICIIHKCTYTKNSPRQHHVMLYDNLGPIYMSALSQSSKDKNKLVYLPIYFFKLLIIIWRHSTSFTLRYREC